MPPFNASSWKDLTKGLACGAKFGHPTSARKLAAVEHALSIRLPEWLREFLQEANGVTSQDGSGIIWSTDDIVKHNQEFRSFEDYRELYMPFDNLLFFGGDGGGNLFAFAIHAYGQIRNDAVFCWEHESDGRPEVAANLEQFLQFRLRWGR